jgi:hypothetical protein
MRIINSELMPRAAQMAGLGVPPWIASASRTRFRRWVAAASNDFAPHERAQLVDAMRPWAESTGELELFRHFQQGDRIPLIDFAGTVRKRRCADWLRAFVNCDSGGKAAAADAV